MTEYPTHFSVDRDVLLQSPVTSICRPLLPMLVPCRLQWCEVKIAMVTLHDFR